MEIIYELLRDIGKLITTKDRIPGRLVDPFVLRYQQFRSLTERRVGEQDHDPAIFNEAVVKLSKVYQHEVTLPFVLGDLMDVYFEVSTAANLARDLFKITIEDIPLYLNTAEIWDAYSKRTNAYSALTLQSLVPLRLNKDCYEERCLWRINFYQK